MKLLFKTFPQTEILETKIDYLEGVAAGAHHLCKLGGIFILENAF